MWFKWFPWRFMVRRVALDKGFIDPIQLMYRFNQFAQPSEVIAPIELLRAGAVLHARGLINYQAIQHNLDWVWPFWVNQQFDPKNKSFIPRAFSLTHINLTHRNWTAVGVPGFSQTPIVDPRGLVMPFFDSWSIDSWIIALRGEELIPSRLPSVTQGIDILDNLKIITTVENKNLHLESKVEAILRAENLSCRVTLTGYANTESWLVISLRPYNPEGISFIHEIALSFDKNGWKVNKKEQIFFYPHPDEFRFSRYCKGDVYQKILTPEEVPKTKIICEVGMATAAALFKLRPNIKRNIRVDIPLDNKKRSSFPLILNNEEQKTKNDELWEKSLEEKSGLELPDQHFKFLYEASLRTLILHTPDNVYAGPYTYKRFWFRDTAFIVHALLTAGFINRAERIIERFLSRQNSNGYFVSQEGEWDSNGEVLWLMQRFCELSGKKPSLTWSRPIRLAAKWISDKRLSTGINKPYAGLLPSGFSTEHLGPNDYYYWDNFWSVAGLYSSGYLLSALGDQKDAQRFTKEAGSLFSSVEKSLNSVSKNLGYQAMPASPYRRMDSGAIGSLAVSYPLKLWSPGNEWVVNTVDYLMKNSLVNGGFFHDIAHSGINPYLTLHIAQALLRAGDKRFFDLMTTIANLASSTGQWPEAIHPRLRTGCMGDCQHVGAAAEWIIMVRNCLIREEETDWKLILCSGVPLKWLRRSITISFNHAPTSFGPLSLSVISDGEEVAINWKGDWYNKEPNIEVWLPGNRWITAKREQTNLTVRL
ncbi:MAG: hypothetical protein V1872_07360 [bacterium]